LLNQHDTSPIKLLSVCSCDHLVTQLLISMCHYIAAAVQQIGAIVLNYWHFKHSSSRFRLTCTKYAQLRGNIFLS